MKSKVKGKEISEAQIEYIISKLQIEDTIEEAVIRLIDNGVIISPTLLQDKILRHFENNIRYDCAKAVCVKAAEHANTPELRKIYEEKANNYDELLGLFPSI